MLCMPKWSIEKRSKLYRSLKILIYHTIKFGVRYKDKIQSSIFMSMKIFHEKVIYDVESKRHIVYANDAIINSQTQYRLLAEIFGLNLYRTFFVYDEHYKI